MRKTILAERYDQVADPFGHDWKLATHQADLPAGEIGRRASSLLARMGGGS